MDEWEEQLIREYDAMYFHDEDGHCHIRDHESPPARPVSSGRHKKIRQKVAAKKRHKSAGTVGVRRHGSDKLSLHGNSRVKKVVVPQTVVRNPAKIGDEDLDMEDPLIFFLTHRTFEESFLGEEAMASGFMFLDEAEDVQREK